VTRLALLLRVSAQSVRHWLRAFATAHDEQPEPTGRTSVLERDEMGHSLKNKRQKLWIWKALDRDPGQLLDWEGGRRDKATLQKLVARLAQGGVKAYCAATWTTDPSVIPQDNLGQRQATTHHLERHHCRQRHWFGRFKRQSMIVSPSKEMGALTLALLAKFWVHGNQDELVSLLG
jgi:insertion element IS1 protein InsB